MLEGNDVVIDLLTTSKNSEISGAAKQFKAIRKILLEGKNNFISYYAAFDRLEKAVEKATAAPLTSEEMEKGYERFFEGFFETAGPMTAREEVEWREALRKPILWK
jgi:hypothetical protein